MPPLLFIERIDTFLPPPLFLSFVVGQTLKHLNNSPHIISYTLSTHSPNSPNFPISHAVAPIHPLIPIIDLFSNSQHTHLGLHSTTNPSSTHIYNFSQIEDISFRVRHPSFHNFFLPYARPTLMYTSRQAQSSG